MLIQARSGATNGGERCPGVKLELKNAQGQLLSDNLYCCRLTTRTIANQQARGGAIAATATFSRNAEKAS